MFLPLVRWDVSAFELLQAPSSGKISCGLYRGRIGDPSLEDTVDMIPVDSREPHEPTADGCPGGWYRSAYVDSIAPLTRRRTKDGGRVENPFFTAATWQAHEAVLYYELEQERHANYRAEVDRSRWDREQSSKKVKRGARR